MTQILHLLNIEISISSYFRDKGHHSLTICELK